MWKATKAIQIYQNCQRIFRIPRRIIGSVIKRVQKFGSVENRSGRDMKRLFTDRDANQLSRIVKQNTCRRRPLQDITTINEGKGRIFCMKTVQRVLTRLEYKRRVAKKQVVVREVNKKKRVPCAKEKKNWTVDAE